MDLKKKLSRLKMPGLAAPVQAERSEEVAESKPQAEARASVQVERRHEAAESKPQAEAVTHNIAASNVIPSDLASRADRFRRNLATLTPKSFSVKTEVAAAPKSGPLPVETRATAHGPIHVRDLLYEANHRHGTADVRAALQAEPPHLAALALDATLSAIDPRRMLLLDTETTGLAGGTGTLPFVLGLGWFEEDRLRVQQFVLRRPGEELPILRLLEDRLATASCLVTYNGKTFDWPLLKSRFVMNRLKTPAAIPHLDLLHCARRIYKRRDGGAKLTHLEAQVLGHVRIGDIPGDQIPELYFRYLRTGDGALVTPVLEHNAHDMVLLAALLGLLARQFKERVAEDPRDALGFALVAARAGDTDRALTFARAAALCGAADRVLCAEALSLVASVSRKKGDVLAAVEALQSAVRVASGALLSSMHLELSKLYEHRLLDPDTALDHARHTQLFEGALPHQKRLARLQKKVTLSGANPRQLGLVASALTPPG